MNVCRTRIFLGAIVVTGALTLPGAASPRGAQALDGKAIVVVGKSATRGYLAISSLAGGEQRPLTPPLAPGERRSDLDPTWSPDGTQVAFTRWTPSELALMVVNEDGSGLRRIAGFAPPKDDFYAIAGAVEGIRWSPDGGKVAFLLTRWVRRTEAIFVAGTTGSAVHRVAATPRGPYSYLSLFGWSPDSTRILYGFTNGEPISLDYTGPAWLKTVSGNGAGRRTVLRDDVIDDAFWRADDSLIYVRHCLMPLACQLTLRVRRARRSRALTHFGLPSSTCCEWDDLEIVSRPQSSDIVYSYGRKIYEVTPSTQRTRRIVTVPCPHRRCRRFDDIVSFVGVTADGRYALIEDDNIDEPRARDYNLDLKTGALARQQLATVDPAAVFLP
jgi:dipeptidyl aminopeptidase/acylaminoacyl peptidase